MPKPTTPQPTGYLAHDWHRRLEAMAHAGRVGATMLPLLREICERFALEPLAGLQTTDIEHLIDAVADRVFPNGRLVSDRELLLRLLQGTPALWALPVPSPMPDRNDWDMGVPPMESVAEVMGRALRAFTKEILRDLRWS